MISLLARRLGLAVVIMWAVASTSFFMTLRLGDPVRLMLGPHARPADREHVRRHFGLDRPAHVQYARYMSHLLRGDFGMSYRLRQPVTTLIAERFPRTALLAVLSIIIEVVVGVLLGTLAAARRGRVTDNVIMTGSFLLMSLPTFLTGQFFLLLFAYYGGLFPIGGYGVGFLDHLWHAALPAITLGLISTAVYARLTRNELVDVLASDYVRTARAKGLSNSAIVVRHALRNAMLPVVTSIGLSFGALFTGAIVTEAIFAWPGMGRLAYEATLNLDVPVIMGCVIFGAFGVQVGNILSDLTYAVLDPRIRRA